MGIGVAACQAFRLFEPSPRRKVGLYMTNAQRAFHPGSGASEKLQHGFKSLQCQARLGLQLGSCFRVRGTCFPPHSWPCQGASADRHSSYTFSHTDGFGRSFVPPGFRAAWKSLRFSSFFLARASRKRWGTTASFFLPSNTRVLHRARDQSNHSLHIRVGALPNQQRCAALQVRHRLDCRPLE